MLKTYTLKFVDFANPLNECSAVFTIIKHLMFS